MTIEDFTEVPVPETRNKTATLKKLPIQKELKDQKKAVLKKLDFETAKLLDSLKVKANKKAYGRKIRDVQIIALGISKIDSEDIKKLQEYSLSAKDRVALAHEEYIKNHPKISMDQFLGKLLRGEMHASSGSQEG